MKIEKVKIDNLKPAEYNPRQASKQQVENLKKSINKFGLVDPIIVNKHPGRENVIIGGHFRVRVAKELGITEMPVVFVDLDIDREKELNLRLNKNLGEWDFDLLANFDKELLGEVGFESEELDKIFDLDLEEDDFDAQKEYEKIKEPESKYGEVYQLGRHKLMCGDATKREDVEKLMGGKKVDMVFTDPPYGIEYIPENEQLKKLGKLKQDSRNYEKFKLFLQNFLDRMIENLKDGGCYYICMGWEHLNSLSNYLRDIGHKVYCQIVWDRETPVLRKYIQDYIPVNENILYGWKRGAKHYNKPIDENQTTIWRIKTLRAKEMIHTTEKPINLSSIAIKNSSKQDDIVLDLFGGSGSTLIACEQLDRICYIMELDPAYCDVIIHRWEQFTGQKAKKIKD